MLTIDKIFHASVVLKQIVRATNIVHTEGVTEGCSLFLKPENLQKKKELWQYLRKQNFPLFIRIRWGFLGQGVNLPGRSGRKIFSVCYKITRKFYGFN